MTASAEEGRSLIEQGFNCVAYWGDLWIYKQGLRQGIAALRATLASFAAPAELRADVAAGAVAMGRSAR